MRNAKGGKKKNKGKNPNYYLFSQRGKKKEKKKNWEIGKQVFNICFKQKKWENM